MKDTKMIEINLTKDQAEALQNAVDDHMMLCYEALDHEGEEVPDYLSDVEMYCGCNVCETREHLVATFNWLRTNNLVDIAVV